jgi:predicted secreted hydrolase
MRRVSLDLEFDHQPPMLQGDRGFSRKGPAQAGYCYSEPHLGAGTSPRGARRAVKGVAWLDPVVDEYLAAEASGWDWLGANLEDGVALMVRIRGKDGKTL